MQKTMRLRTIATASLLLACLFFSAGASQALALERADGELEPGHGITLFERIGDFLCVLVVDLSDLFLKDGPETGPDG